MLLKKKIIVKVKLFIMRGNGLMMFIWSRGENLSFLKLLKKEGKGMKAIVLGLRLSLNFAKLRIMELEKFSGRKMRLGE